MQLDHFVRRIGCAIRRPLLFLVISLTTVGIGLAEVNILNEPIEVK